MHIGDFDLEAVSGAISPVDSAPLTVSSGDSAGIPTETPKALLTPQTAALPQTGQELQPGTVQADIEPLITELVGVNEKLSVMLAVAVIAIAWKCLTASAKFLDMFF